MFNKTKAPTKPLTEKSVNRLYQQSPSIVDWLPWVDYESDSQTFTLEDGYSAAAMFEVQGISTEARSAEFLEEIRLNIQTCLNHAIPAYDNPFVMQCFVSDDYDLSELSTAIDQYPGRHDRSEGSHQTLAADYFKRMQCHLHKLSSTAFEDMAVSGGPWQGKVRKIRVFLYRRRSPHDAEKQNPVAEVTQVSEQWLTQLLASGLKVHRCNDEDLYAWLLRWFNPKLDAPLLSSAKLNTTPTDEQPFGYDLSELLFLSQPRSDHDQGLWWFDDMAHKALTVDSIKRKPVPGHLTGERSVGDNLYALFDRLPEHAIFSVTITIQPQDLVENHLVQIRNASKGETSEALASEQDAQEALSHLSKGDYLFPTVMTLFVRGEDEPNLQQNINDASALLLANGLHLVRPKDELIPLDTYIRQLPMNYEPSRDTVSRKSRLVFSSDLACLLPFYGRSRGTGNPGLVFYNRGGEPLTFDPLNALDRSKNAFGLVLGPPGSGKSALMVYILMQVVATYGARIYIVDKGGSFKLFGDYCANFGLSVNHVCLHPKENVSLPPFADAIEALSREQTQGSPNESETDNGLNSEADTDSDTDDGERDVLGEMELKARIMITGGDPKEESLMTRADRLGIRTAILDAARQKQQQAAGATVLTEDVVEALNKISRDSSLTSKRSERIKDMADAMALYCSGTAGDFFNRGGQSWPEADITILDMGLLANEGYEDQLALGFMGLMNQINGVVEREQYSDRPTFVLVDEAHLITTNPLLSIYLVKMVKMWRKLGAWLWLATQNLEDFPDNAKKLLNMFEWWIAMVCPKQEIEQIARFKDLSDEQKNMLQAARKDPGKYTEGVVLADTLQCLFRNIPPPLALALAMTEKHEKQQRKQIMIKKNCSEFEAVLYFIDERK